MTKRRYFASSSSRIPDFFLNFSVLRLRCYLTKVVSAMATVPDQRRREGGGDRVGRRRRRRSGVWIVRWFDFEMGEKSIKWMVVMELCL